MLFLFKIFFRAKSLNIKPKNIRNWFCYKRKIDRLRNKEAKSTENLQNGSNVSTEMTVNNNQPLQNNFFMRNPHNTFISNQIFPNNYIPPNSLMPSNNQINLPLGANTRGVLQNPMPNNTQMHLPIDNMRNGMQNLMPINNQINLPLLNNMRASMQNPIQNVQNTLQNMQYYNFMMPTTMQRPMFPFNGYSFNF